MIRGTKKFVQAIRKLQTPTTAMPGAAIGNTMRKSPWNVEAPSIQAASSSSKGTESKKFFISQIENGKELATKNRITPCSVSTRFSETYIAYSGVTSARMGSELMNRMVYMRGPLKRNWYRESGYAARLARMITSSIVLTARIRLLVKGPTTIPLVIIVW